MANSITQVDEKLTLDATADMDETEKVNIQKLYRETLHQCYNFGFEVGSGPFSASSQNINHLD